MRLQAIKEQLAQLLWGRGSLAWRLISNEYILLNVAVISTYYLFRQPHLGATVDVITPVLTLLQKLKLTPRMSAAAEGDEYEDDGDEGTPRLGVFGSPVDSAAFPTLEMQVAASLALTALARAYRSTSHDALAATLLAYTQIFVIFITALTDVVAACWYLLAFLLIFLLFNEPTYTGPSNVEVLTAQLFVEKCATKETAGGVTYVVFMGTQWSSRCRHAYPLFADLSLRYSTEKLKFARLDVGVWPHIARSLKLDLSSVSSQLPTVIGFQGGEEYARVPQGTTSTFSGVGKWTFSRVELISGLQLDTKFATTMGAPTTGGASSQPAAAST